MIRSRTTRKCRFLGRYRKDLKSRHASRTTVSQGITGPSPNIECRRHESKNYTQKILARIATKKIAGPTMNGNEHLLYGKGAELLLKMGHKKVY